MANWLSDRRRTLGLSQEDVVELLSASGMDVSRGTISHWETGRTPLPLDDERLRSTLAAVLKVTVPQLLLMAGYEVSEEYTSYGQEAMRAAEIVQHLSPTTRELALRILEQFTSAKMTR